MRSIPLAFSTTLAIALALLGCAGSSTKTQDVGQPDVPAGGAGGTTSPTSTGTGGAATGGTSGNGGMTNAGGTTEAGGTIGSGGSSGTGGTVGGTAPRCGGMAATCGPLGTDDCCKSLLVPGGTFNRSYDGVDFTDPNYPATVSDFYLDKYEITVGRFRHFVNAGVGTQAKPPAEGDGAHPLIAGSGWESTWNGNLPADTTSLKAAMSSSCGFTSTWTDTPQSNESMPVNCLDWHKAFAFCAWDEGRLPTEAEWNYAASGGSEQRYYPWSSPATSTTVDDSYVVYCGGTCSILNVGSKSPKGDGKWGQADLAGNVWEWTLDSFAEPYPNPCSDCAELIGYARVARGGYFDSRASSLRSANRENNDPVFRGSGIGARCARSGP